MHMIYLLYFEVHLFHSDRYVLSLARCHDNEFVIADRRLPI